MSRAHSIASVIDDIAALHAPFPESLRGCTSDEVSALQTAIGGPLPPCYREFMERMGHETGGLQLHVRGFAYPSVDFSFANMLDYARKRRWKLPPRFILIGEELDDPYDNVYLDLATPSKPSVVRFGTNIDPRSIDAAIAGDFRAVAQSLAEMVFGSALATFVLPRYRSLAAADARTPDPDFLAKADALCSKQGLSKHPQSTGYSRFYLGPDAVVTVFDNVKEPARFEVHTYKPQLAQRLGALASDHLDLLLFDYEHKS